MDLPQVLAGGRTLGATGMISSAGGTRLCATLPWTGNPTTYNTPYTARSYSSKILSKNASTSENLGNTRIFGRFVLPGVSLKDFSPSQKQGYQTRLNTDYTPEFSTNSVSQPANSTASDVQAFWCASSIQNAIAGLYLAKAV